MSGGRKEKKADKKSIAAAVGLGADKKRIESAVNATRASEVFLREREESPAGRDRREAYENGLLRKAERPFDWRRLQEQRELREKNLEPER